MIEIRPFPAIIYNYKHKLCKPNKVICPPYDVISPAQARSYRRLSPFNMIHLTLPKKAKGRNEYKVAVRRFHDYLRKQVFFQDRQPAIYLYRQDFKTNQAKGDHQTKEIKFRRLGFIACLGLAGSSSIFGHEHTRIEPKEDRFKLLLNVQANLEPIFVLFTDPGGSIQQLLNRYVRANKPLIRFLDQEQNNNTFWRLVNPDILSQIKRRMGNKIIFIADGHHRYEVSLNYQELMLEKLKQAHMAVSDKEGWNYIMAYFCPMQSPGLVIKPVHRLLKGIHSLPMDKFRKLFYIRKTTRKELTRLMQSKTSQQRMLGVYFKRNFYIFILKNKQILGKIDKDYRSLDISLLNRLVLRQIFRVEPEDRKRVIFGANARDLISQADKHKTSVVFFLKSVKIDDIVRLAQAGKKMPAKTTYFYPKIPSGLAIHKFS
ncbi:MAG: DUF1015 domain-containing protein [Candidatus Omnitrophota bacterium]|jgi:uncharacterized protein (DUF1015 family)